MLFNSIVFIFAYLPVVLIGYYAISASRLAGLRLYFLAAASLFFYGYWAPKYVALLLFSMMTNYCLAKGIEATTGRKPLRRGLLLLGLTFNLSLLAYFKYLNFLVDNVNVVLRSHIHLAKIVLPLAISFFTFQKIAFLIDLYRGKIKLGGVGQYLAFVLFFPQLIAGPIVHFSEMAPQLAARPKLNLAAQNILFGLSIFGIGLFKKTVFADTAALYASPLFNSVAHGGAPSFAGAWLTAFCYTLQIYFDFSGYSDMAIGLARMFGVLLPLNFHSPLRSNNMAELWRRWHMTLGRFVQSYIFQPISIPLARMAAERTKTRLGMFALSTMFPTFLSMLIIGVWHGAGWNFLIFGALHGTYVCSHELWHFLRRKKRREVPVRPPHHHAGARLLTVVAFVFATVPFRAANVHVTMQFFAAMIPVTGLPAMQSGLGMMVPFGVAGTVAVLAIGYAVVLLLPNTQQFMSIVEPALEWPKWSKIDTPPIRFAWRPTVVWSVVTSVFLFLGIAFIMRGTTEFIYFNF